MARGAAARRYARALFALARDENRVSEIRQELAAMAGLLDESEDLRNTLFRPLHPVSERRAVLDRVASGLGASPILRHFYAFLVDQRRLVDFPAIRSAYEELADREAGRLRAEVAAASPIGDQQLERLRRALAARTGKDIELSVELDPALLAGVVAKVGDLVFDGSLRTQLRQLRASLMKG